MKVAQILDWLRAQSLEVDDTIMVSGTHVPWPVMLEAAKLADKLILKVAELEAQNTSLLDQLGKAERLANDAKKLRDQALFALDKKNEYISLVHLARPAINIDISRYSERIANVRGKRSNNQKS